MATARRNVRCVACRRLRPELESRRGTINGVAGVWACRRCWEAMAEQPEPDPSWPEWDVLVEVQGRVRVRAFSSESAADAVHDRFKAVFLPETMKAALTATVYAADAVDETRHRSGAGKEAGA